MPRLCPVVGACNLGTTGTVHEWHRDDDHHRPAAGKGTAALDTRAHDGTRVPTTPQDLRSQVVRCGWGRQEHARHGCA